MPFEETNVFFKWTPLALYRYSKLKQAAIGAGKSVLLEKTPRHIRRVDRIRRLVPGAKFVMPVRDGRDTVASLTKRLGDATESLDRWISDNTMVLAERGSTDVLIYRYEDLVNDPEATIEKICTFLGLSFDQSLLDYHRNPQQWFKPAEAEVETQHAALRNQQVNKPIYDGRGRWKTELGQMELKELTEGRGKPLMQAFGYV
ncbi:sulfotransferase [Mesorhizobium sp.]|uniref:sulfotransferase family protein n=1 Tax=Mesorhizobium sp. TaxID=1871066 RepID=UPI002580AACC|nr:sulfotransferase [Mesorhizobium sp.]